MRICIKPPRRDIEWTPWFAWFPVQIGDHMVWLEWVERYREYGRDDYWWEYRHP